MTIQDAYMITTEIWLMASSQKFMLAALVFIVLPMIILNLIPRLAYSLSVPRRTTLEGIEWPSRFWLVMIDVARFVVASTSQAIIGAVALLLTEEGRKTIMNRRQHTAPQHVFETRLP